ncbi:MAG TPA: MFS transporter [Polyangiaceae bacterium]|nr:MFS transporter [Polyangiaceae bacterium]
MMNSAAPSLARQPNFLLYLAARACAATAVQMQGVAVGWQVYELTRNALDLGWIGLAQFAPFLVLILPAGEVADRYSRRLVISSCLGLQLLCSLFLLAFSRGGLTSVWPVFSALVLLGTARAFSMPAQQAILMNLVPEQSFRQAMALSSSSFHAAVIVGPTLGGLLYIAGPSVVYTTVAGLLALSLALMLCTRTSQQVSTRRPPVTFASLVEGLRFVWNRKPILGAISLDLFAVLLGGAVALLPAYARDILHVQASGLGLLRTAPGVGAAATAALLAIFPIHRHVGRWMFGGVAVFGLATVVLGITSSFGVALAALAMTGAGDMVSVYVRHVLVQLETPDAIRGRVSAVNAVFIGASNELGEFESGIVAAALGLLPAIVVGGAATLLVTGLWMRWFPMLSRMDRFPHAARDTPLSAPTIPAGAGGSVENTQS